jgi:hypothetical protein
MSENIWKLPNGGIAIINGGDPLPGCPENWEEARKIEILFNNGREKSYDSNPYWSFDCGFKLDYDGSLITINSRFYPPTTHGGKTWDGTVTIELLGNKIREWKFDCQTIEELRNQVEAYVNEFIEHLKNLITPSDK